MAPGSSVKLKRHKKRKSRTEVSSDSESEPEVQQVPEQASESPPQPKKPVKKPTASQTTAAEIAPKSMTDAEASAAFTKFYMQRVTTEFSDDLDKLRGADDFRDDAVPLLIGALQQGTSLFSMEEKRRIVMAGLEDSRKGKEGTR